MPELPLGHSLPNHTAMSPLVTDFDGNLSAHRADHSEQNDTNMSKIESAVPSRDVVNRKFVPAVRTASAASVRTASASALHCNPKVLPPNSNGNLRPLT